MGALVKELSVDMDSQGLIIHILPILPTVTCAKEKKREYRVTFSELPIAPINSRLIRLKVIAKILLNGPAISSLYHPFSSFVKRNPQWIAFFSR